MNEKNKQITKKKKKKKKGKKKKNKPKTMALTAPASSKNYTPTPRLFPHLWLSPSETGVVAPGGGVASMELRRA